MEHRFDGGRGLDPSHFASDHTDFHPLDAVAIDRPVQSGAHFGAPRKCNSIRVPKGA